MSFVLFAASLTCCVASKGLLGVAYAIFLRQDERTASRISRFPDFVGTSVRTSHCLQLLAEFFFPKHSRLCSLR